MVGGGADYQDATYTSAGAPVSDNMVVTITNAQGDYLFLKVDKRQTVNNLYTYPGQGMEQFEYPIALDSPVEDGDYMVYKSTNRYVADTAQYKINKV